jgi:UDP-N-acetyl-D-galactosamine dehydrogenase
MTRKVAVIGLGYVGLPVCTAFARAGIDVIGYDISTERIAELKGGYDRTREVDLDDLRLPSLTLSDHADDLKAADFFIVTVPTPIDDTRRPDLRALQSASRLVGKALKIGDIVVFESTVYPGATEEDCVPLLESVSGLKAGSDFTVGYSPERINPGDKSHRFGDVAKVISGQDDATTDIVAEVYSAVVRAEIYRAPSIKVAEAAKVLENTQRDLNIALMNELAAICGKLGIDTLDVIDAAATKWNFARYTPGLVGGHCIGVDPYYLTHRAEKAGYHPEVILAGRRINDNVGVQVARECVRRLLRRPNGSRVVTILGVTFKENVPDTRNSKVPDIARELAEYGIDVQIYDPLADPRHVEEEYGLKLTPLGALAKAAVVIVAVPHLEFVGDGWKWVTTLLEADGGVVMDVKSVLDRASRPSAVELWRL